MRPGTSPSRHDEAVRWAAHWSQRWFEAPDGEDRFRLGPIDAGRATHVEAYLILLDTASEALGIRGQERSARSWLKRRGLDRTLRAAGLRLRSEQGPRRSPVAAIVEIPTPSMAHPAAMTIAAAGAGGVLGVTDPRAAGVASAFGLGASPVVVGWREERRLVRAARATLAKAWNAFRAECPPMPLGELDLGPVAIRRLAPLVERSMPYLASESLAVERFLRATNPGAVAIASDQHRIGRVTVAKARGLGIRTVVLQHGLPQARIGYLPVVADRVAAWSPASRQWFVDAGTPPEAVVVTGNPRADAMRDTAKAPGGGCDVLLALSPTARETNAALIGLVLDAVAGLDEARLTIKLHPGQGDWSFVSRLVKPHPARGRVVVRHHEPLGALLAAASVVVVHRSSVAIEALAAGRPVIVGRSGTEPTTADLELSSARLPVCSSSRELVEAISLLSRPAGVREYFAERSPAIEEHVGPSGGSVGRILELMGLARAP